VYGEPRWKGIAESRLRDVCATFPRQALHAWRLTCAHPVTGAPLEIVAPLPADVRALAEAAGVADLLEAPSRIAHEGSTLDPAVRTRCVRSAETR